VRSDRIVDLAGRPSSEAFQARPHQGFGGAGARFAQIADAAGTGRLERRAARPCSERHLEGSSLQAKTEELPGGQSDAQYAVPARIGDFTDLYTSIHHATAVGRMMRPDKPCCRTTNGSPSGITVAFVHRFLGQTFRRPRASGFAGRGANPSSAPYHAPGTTKSKLWSLRRQRQRAGHAPFRLPTPRRISSAMPASTTGRRAISRLEYQPMGPFLEKNFRDHDFALDRPRPGAAPFRVPVVRPEAPSRRCLFGFRPGHLDAGRSIPARSADSECGHA